VPSWPVLYCYWKYYCEAGPIRTPDPDLDPGQPGQWLTLGPWPEAWQFPNIVDPQWTLTQAGPSTIDPGWPQAQLDYSACDWPCWQPWIGPGQPSWTEPAQLRRTDPSQPSPGIDSQPADCDSWSLTPARPVDIVWCVDIGWNWTDIGQWQPDRSHYCDILTQTGQPDLGSAQWDCVCGLGPYCIVDIDRTGSWTGGPDLVTWPLGPGWPAQPVLGQPDPRRTDEAQLDGLMTRTLTLAVDNDSPVGPRTASWPAPIQWPWTQTASNWKPRLDSVKDRPDWPVTDQWLLVLDNTWWLTIVIYNKPALKLHHALVGDCYWPSEQTWLFSHCYYGTYYSSWLWSCVDSWPQLRQYLFVGPQDIVDYCLCDSIERMTLLVIWTDQTILTLLLLKLLLDLLDGQYCIIIIVCGQYCYWPWYAMTELCLVVTQRKHC